MMQLTFHSRLSETLSILCRVQRKPDIKLTQVVESLIGTTIIKSFQK